jgi:hypothetical protein
MGNKRDPLDKYILVGNEVVRVTFDEWRRIALHKRNGVRVSTVFLGIDHNFGLEGPPIVFETMVFIDDAEDDERGNDYGQWRYSTYDEALLGHIRVCNRVFAPGWKERALEEGPYFEDDDEVSDEADGDRA